MLELSLKLMSTLLKRQYIATEGSNILMTHLSARERIAIRLPTLQVDVYLLFIAIKSCIKSLEITVSESDQNPQSSEITTGYNKMP